jgi:DtxR family Mn-dependent transcriptional regulator
MLVLKNITESEQMYLVTIALLGESAGEFPVHISQLAEALQVTPISVNQKVHHLQTTGLVEYTPYRGCDLTETGWRIAKKILRARRLWEVFLVEHLHYDPAEAEDLACNLEHAIPSESAKRLAAFLDWPQASPQGKPIPQSEGRIDLPPGMHLSDMTAGMSGVVKAIETGDTEREFLHQAGIRVGTQIGVLSIQGGVGLLARTSDGETIGISAELAHKILVIPEE